MDLLTWLSLGPQLVALCCIVGALLLYLFWKLVSIPVVEELPEDTVYDRTKTVLISSVDSALGLEIATYLSSKGWRVRVDRQGGLGARLAESGLQAHVASTPEDQPPPRLVTLELEAREDLLKEAATATAQHLPADEHDYRMDSKKKSLDAVDLNILPISQKLDEGRLVTLGSKSNLGLGNKEYYKLEIKTNDTREERNDQVIENVICHICDINVPKVYLNEHKNSFRHKFSITLADIALRKLQLFMNKDEVNESYEEIPSKHYCSECSLVIDSEDKISHKQSIVHRNSIFLERFLNDFLKFYTNDENEINDSKEDSKKIEVAKETKHCEDYKKGFDSYTLNTSETVIISDSKEDRKNIEVANETKHCKIFKKGVDSDPSNISETIIASDLKYDTKNIVVANETKHCEDSKKGVDSDASNISETIIVSDLKEDRKNIVVANETKHSEDSKKGVDSDPSNISKNIIVSDLKNDTKNIVVTNETKHCEDSKKGVDSGTSNISETITVSDLKADSKKFKRDLDSDKENKKIDSSPILHKALTVKDQVVFKTDDGRRYKVNKVNFNSLMRIGTYFELCAVCDQVIPIEYRNLHLKGELHSKNLLLNQPDDNCIRAVTCLQFHCILCNEKFEYLEEHVLACKEHITNVQNMRV